MPRPTTAPLFVAPPVAMALPPKPTTYRREPTACAAHILDGMTREERRVILCKGQIDMTDLVLAGATLVGPSHVTVSAWEIDEDDVLALGAAVKDGRILSLQLVTEPGVRREGKTWEKARAAFGEERVLFQATHAKIATLETADGWALVIRGSMNMRRQRVIEQLEVEHSPEICAAWRAYVADPQFKAKFPGADAPELGRAALAKMPAGGRLFGLIRGFSAIDLLRAALDRVGPADVEIIGFKLGEAEARELAGLAAAGRIKDLRVLVSPAFIAQNPGPAKEVERAIGADRCKLAWSHGRFFVVRGADRAVVVHSSANLNRNPRCEQYDASEEPETVAFFSRLHLEIWAQTPDGIHTPRPQIVDVLRGLLVDQTAPNGEPPPPPLELPPQTPEKSLMVMGSRLAHLDAPINLAAYAADPPLSL